MPEIYVILDHIIIPRGLDADQPEVSEHYYLDEERALRVAIEMANQGVEGYRLLRDGHTYTVHSKDIGHPYRAWVEDETGLRLEEFLVLWALPDQAIREE